MTPRPIAENPAGRRGTAFRPKVTPLPELSQTRPAFSASELADPVRKFSFNLCLVLVFLRFSMLHQTLAYVLHVNLYLMYVFGVPPLIGALICGGFRRSMQGRTAFFWCGFAAWMLLAIPTSTWRGASVGLANDYLRTDLSMLFIVAGLTLTWKECEKLLWAGAFGAFAVLLTSRLFQSDDPDFGGRLGLQMGTVSNPNDYAGHLMLALCFLLWIAFSQRSKFLRTAAFGGVGFALLLILKTASRGAEVGVAAGALFYLFKGTGRQRMALVVVTPIILAAIFALVPSDALRRLQSFSSSGSGDVGAIESTESRTYLLKTSLRYTAEFPLFGVGPGQFAVYEGGHNTIGGTDHGSWHDTHNSYTQASSECGIPGGIFFLAGVLSTIFMLAGGLREARRRTDSRDIQNAFFCVLTGTIAFYVTIAFLNFAYFFYEPFLAALTIAMCRAAKEEYRLRDARPVVMQPPPLAGGYRGKLQAGALKTGAGPVRTQFPPRPRIWSGA